MRRTGAPTVIRRLWRPVLFLALLGTGLSSVALPAVDAAPAPARSRGSASTAPEPFAQLVDRYHEAAAALAAGESELHTAEATRDEARVASSRADSDLAVAASDVARQRGRIGKLGAEFFVRQGSADRSADESMQLALSGQQELLQQLRAVERDAASSAGDLRDQLERAQEEVDHVASALEEVRSRADDATGALEQALADAGAPELPAVAYVAYLDAAGRVDEAHPGCHLPGAALAGLGQLASAHGRNRQASIDALGRVAPTLRNLRGDTGPDTDRGRLDRDFLSDVAMGPMQLDPSQWAAHGTDGDGDGVASPDDVFDSATTMAEILCSPGDDLTGFAALRTAVTATLGDSQQATAALAAGRRYGVLAPLGLGTVPVDPEASATSGEPGFDATEVVLAPGDATGMIAWAMTRLGTPYSQCLGPDVRPQDPVCPPGTNRFGSGFFDCSGFVSHAYRLIGLKIPLTTYAMEADSRFMSTEVSDHFDLSVMRPGDVFLMDGHTGMYVGGGMIIHAIGRGLTYQPVPTWVRNGTIAVLRPLDLLPQSGAVPGLGAIPGA